MKNITAIATMAMLGLGSMLGRKPDLPEQPKQDAGIVDDDKILVVDGSMPLTPRRKAEPKVTIRDRMQGLTATDVANLQAAEAKRHRRAVKRMMDENKQHAARLMKLAPHATNQAIVDAFLACHPQFNAGDHGTLFQTEMEARFRPGTRGQALVAVLYEAAADVHHQMLHADKQAA